jgi:hypothetical protein
MSLTYAMHGSRQGTENQRLGVRGDRARRLIQDTWSGQQSHIVSCSHGDLRCRHVLAEIGIHSMCLPEIS